MAFTPTSTSLPSTSTTALVTDDTFMGFKLEVDLIAQAIAEAKEQLRQVIEVKQEEDLQWRLERNWEEWMLELDSVVTFVNKQAVVVVTKAVAKERDLRWWRVSVRFPQAFSSEFDLGCF